MPDGIFPKSGKVSQRFWWRMTLNAFEGWEGICCTW